MKSSSDDLQTRLVVISLVQEGRGLDAGPKLLEKLKSQKEKKGMEILKIILEEEVGHVSIGMKWFKYLCEINGEKPVDKFKDILKKKNLKISPPVNAPARAKAGFEMEWLT